MAALIPYEAAEAMPMFTQMGPELYKDTKWAARKIGRGISKAWRKKRSKRATKKRKTNFGEAIGTSEHQRSLTVSAVNVPNSTRTLVSGDLVNIVRATNHEIDERHRDIINVKGIKLCFNILNLATKPLYFNVAVVVPKFSQAASTVSGGDFFRNNQDGRGTDFTNALQALEFHCLPINADKFHVLMHQRFLLGPSASSSGYSTGENLNYANISKWLPINRQIRYENNVPVNGRIQYVYWADLMDGAPSDLPVSLTYDVSQHHVVYYKSAI